MNLYAELLAKVARYGLETSDGGSLWRGQLKTARIRIKCDRVGIKDHRRRIKISKLPM
jgi:hypothetical protein